MEKEKFTGGEGPATAGRSGGRSGSWRPSVLFTESFDALDSRQKGTYVLILGIAAIIAGIVFTGILVSKFI